MAAAKEILAAGLVPVLHGDAVIDADQGSSIVSGDLILETLCNDMAPAFWGASASARQKTAGLVARSSNMGLVSLRGQWHLEMGLDGPAHIPARVVQAARPTSRTQSFRSMALPELETEHGSQEN